MKVVINNCYGGFSLSREAFLELRKMGNKHALEERDYGEMYSDGSGPRTSLFSEGSVGSFLYYIPRNDADLIAVVESLKERANGTCSSLKIVEIPDGVEWEVEDYDGREWIAEKHRIWS